MHTAPIYQRIAQPGDWVLNVSEWASGRTGPVMVLATSYLDTEYGLRLALTVRGAHGLVSAWSKDYKPVQWVVQNITTPG